MSITIAILRTLLGLIFLIADFRQLILHKAPPGTSREQNLMKSFAETGYLIPLIKGTEIVAAVLLIFNVWVPFALVLLAPVTVNIFFFHFFLGNALFRKENLAGLAVVFLHLLLFWAYRDSFWGLFSDGGYGFPV